MSFIEIIQLIITYFIIFGIPILSLIWFAVSLTMFLREKDPELRKKKKIMMIVSACAAGVFVVCLASFMLIAYLSIVYM